MATRPELHIAVAKQKSKASDYNDNFDMMMDYCEAVSTEAKDYVDTTLAGNVFYRILGETIFSLIPLADASVHLLDGTIISGSGIYKDFVEEMVSLASTYPDCFCTEAQWQQSITDHGVCGKFVNNGTSIRLPKVTGIVEGTIDVSALGDLVEAYTSVSVPYTGWGKDGVTPAPSRAQQAGKVIVGSGNVEYTETLESLNGANNNVEATGTTVQPQTIKGYYYIVVATATKTDIEVDIDEIASDLNGKAEVDLSNINPTQTAISTIVGWGLPDYDAGVSVGNPTSSDKFTAPSNGIYVFLGGTNNAGRTLYINAVSVAFATQDAADGTAYQSLTVPLSEDDEIYWDSSQGIVYKSTFYPFKGSSND